MLMVRFGMMPTKFRKCFLPTFNLFLNLLTLCLTRILFDVVKNRISMDNYNHLQDKYTSLEVVTTMSQLKSNVAPGPDGLTAAFYQNYWDIIGSDMVDLALNCSNNNRKVDDINHTFICLIPKLNSSTTPPDFRPISLCNVLLKIITKTITNRIKSVLPFIISDHQSAFLHGRLITENTLLAYEVFH